MKIHQPAAGLYLSGERLSRVRRYPALRLSGILLASLVAAALPARVVYAAESAAHADEHDGPAVTMPESKNQIMKFTDSGVEPTQLTLRPEDSVVFFLNDTSDSLITLELDYKDRVTHCNGGNLAVREKGIVATKEPIEPRNFDTTCFHQPGKYPVKIFGLKQHPQGLEASIVVQ